MQYFVLSEAAGTAETGPEFPQSQSMTSGYDYDGERSIHRLAECKSKRPSFSPDLDALVLHPQAKRTDVISSAMLGGQGLLVSERLKNLLTGFLLPEHVYFPAVIVHKNERFSNFQWLHLISDYRKVVLFDQSIFKMNQVGFEDIIKFRDFDDYQRFEKDVDKFELLRSVKIVLDSGALHGLDMFVLSQFDVNIYISEKLVNKLLSEKVTGIEISKRCNGAHSLRH